MVAFREKKLKLEMIDGFITWLKEEASGIKAGFLVIICAFTAVIVANINLRLIFYFFDLHYAGEPFALTWFIIPMIFLAALREEIVYRLPISFFVSVFELGRTSLVAIVLLQFFFGLAHGHLYNIPAQGMAGCFFAVVYLKSGGAHGKALKPMLASSACHALYNFIITVYVFLSQ